MNNTFDIRRFGNYALLNYWYHRRAYIGAIVGVVVMLLIRLCNHRVSFLASTWSSDMAASDRVLDIFSGAFYFVGPLFAIWIIRTSMLGVDSRRLTMHDVLIPVSTFERYLFAILNSTLVASVVYITIFQIVSSCIEPLYLYSDSGYVFKGFIGYRESEVVDGGFSEVCQFSLKEIVCNLGLFRPYIYVPFSILVNLFILLYTTFISIFMWGEITFQNRGGSVLAILLHLAIAAAVILLFAYTPYKDLYPTGALYISYNVDELMERNIWWIVYSLYLFPITYQWVTWKKLKTLSLTK